MTITHEPDCAGWDAGRRDEHDPCDSWCYGCMRCEPARLIDYLVCGECMHVFRTAEELEHADRSNRPTLGPGEEPPSRPADQIAVCPICAHDF